MASPQHVAGFGFGLALVVTTALAGTASAQNLPVTAASPSDALPRVTISGSAPDPMNEPAGITEPDDRPLGKTPASANVVTARDLRENGTTTLSSIGRTVPSLGDAYNTTGFVETLQLRGFRLESASPLNYRRNGLPVSNYAPFAPEDKEAIEFLFGMNGNVAGGGSPGGVINYRTKRPTTSALAAVNTEVSERGTWHVDADLADRVGAFGYRVNLATEERRPNSKDAPGHRRFASGAMDLKLPGNGLFEFEIESQRSTQFSVPGYSLLAPVGQTSGTVLPPPIDARINLNSQPWSQPFESHQTVGTVRLEQPIGASVKVGLRALAQRIMTNDRIAFPDGCSAQVPAVYPGLCANYDVDIYDYRSDHELRTTRSTEAYAAARVDTGGIGHALRVGARTTRYAERLPEAQAYNFVGTVNVFAPVDLPPDPTLSVLNTNRDLVLNELFAADAIALAPAWTLDLALRHVRVKSSSALSDGTEAVALSDSALLPYGALSWSPREGTLLYASAGSDIVTDVVPNRPAEFDNPGQSLPIGRSRQVELGYKQALSPGHWLTVALFEIRKPQYVDLQQPGGTLLRVGNGQIARHRGVEVQASEAVTRSLSVGMAATWLDARLRESLDPALNNKRPTNVPIFAGNVFADLRPAADVNVVWRNRLNVSGRKQVLADNSVSLPASWQWDTAIFWTPAAARPALQVRAGVDNVTDRRYWREAPTQSWGATYLFPAQPRTYRVGVTAQW